MATEKLPCGHEVNPEILRYHEAFERMRKEQLKTKGTLLRGPGSNLLAHYTCNEHQPSLRYEYVPLRLGFWRIIVPKKKPPGDTAPIPPTALV